MLRKIAHLKIEFILFNTISQHSNSAYKTNHDFYNYKIVTI